MRINQVSTIRGELQYDRIVNNGAVVDYLNVGIGQLRTGIFNVADVFIMVGVVMLLIHAQIFKQKKKMTYNLRIHLTCRRNAASRCDASRDKTRNECGWKGTN